jgi:adenylate cyclase
VGQIEAALLVVIGLLLALLLPLLTPAWGATLLAALLLGGLLLNLCVWVLAGQVLPMASPLFYTLGAALLQMSYSFLVESRHKRRLSRLFGQYVPPEIVEEMDRSGQEVSLAGTSREMTVLFADVRGFTRIAEGLEPAVLTEIMNAFLTPITRVIHQHRGTVDKYMGDAVMAFWGAHAALDMVRTLRELRPQFEARGWPVIEIGIGLSTGMMHVGNMGSAFRVAYTVLGDAVNLGARLEALTRQYEVDIIVSEATARQAPEFAYRELDRVRVKGKTQLVTIFEPLGRAEPLPRERQIPSARGPDSGALPPLAK